MSNPLYSLLLAYTNDFLDHDDMAAAAGGMVFINGLGAVTGPLIIGWAMGPFGASAYFMFIAFLGFSIAGYAAYRMTRRASTPIEDTDAMTMVSMSASHAAVAFATEVAIDAAQDEEE